MKKLIVFLIAVQMVLISMYGLLLLRGYAVGSLINEDTASMMLVFDTPEEYHFFLNLAERKGLTVTRPVFIDDTNLIMYTSDLSLDSQIELIDGRWPDAYEFISDIDTGKSNQVGLIRAITPGFNLSIRGIDNITNVEIHGMYFVNSTDLDVVQSFVDELDDHIYRAELASISHDVNMFSQITIIQIMELFIMSLLLFICILATIVNYAVSKLKLGSVLIIHGYHKFNIIKKLAVELLALLLLAFVISYMLVLTYMSLAGYSFFLGTISLYFALICSILFVVYMMVANIFMGIYLLLVKMTNILKGKKPYVILQFANHLSKIVFLAAILLFGSLAINNFIELSHRKKALSGWELAQNIHTTRIYSVGQSSDLAIDLDIMTRQLDLYARMSKEHHAFIMNSRNVLFLEQGLMPYADMDSAPPMELSPNGYRITISPNFLDLNPITAVNEIPIVEQIIYDPYVLNILVPEKLSPYEDEILNLYLDYFYFSSVRVDNIYNEDLGYELNTTPIENLSINIIYVENEQYYFSFNYQVRPEDGNQIKDPIAVLYTGSVNPSHLSSSMSGDFFFHSESIDAHQSILPLLLETGLSHVIRSTESVFDQNSTAIVELREQFIRMVVLIFVLVISSLTILYSLMSSYFEKNKLEIFIKSITGYYFIKRHLKFLLLISLYHIGLMVIVSLFFGYKVLILGMIVSVLDIFFMFLLDKRLVRESFSKIMKGER